MSTYLGINPAEPNRSNSNNELIATLSEQRKQAALDLAELIYDVFVANEASVSMDQKG